MEFIAIGKIIKPQGIKGEVKILLYIDSGSAIKKIKQFYLGSEIVKTAKQISVRSGFAFIKFEDVNSVGEAETLRNLEVCVNKGEIELEQDTFFVEDLIGATVFDQENNKLGTLVDIEKYGAADIWILQEKENQIYSFPYLSQIVKKVYPKQKIIIVDKDRLDEAKV